MGEHEIWVAVRRYSEGCTCLNFLLLGGYWAYPVKSHHTQAVARGRVVTTSHEPVKAVAVRLGARWNNEAAAIHKSDVARQFLLRIHPSSCVLHGRGCKAVACGISEAVEGVTGQESRKMISGSSLTQRHNSTGPGRNTSSFDRTQERSQSASIEA